MDVAAWLRDLGLECYEQAFRDNDIDARVLPCLTADDLKDLGVGSVGHRRRLLEAIAALGREPGAADRAVNRAEPARPAPETEAPAPVAGRPVAPEAERRQLTVLFSDLVGSTALAGALDPEDLREVIRAYHRCVAEVVERFEGHVAKYVGDGVLAYFGYPRAHEDDAERAVRAGLALVDAVGRLEPRDGLGLRVRVGIATGLVVVGDLIGTGSAREEAVIGATPNLAARLQVLAKPGEVVIGGNTRRLLGGLFELADLGVQHLKGFAEPERAWRVLGEGLAENRFEALRGGAALTPLVGREHELGLLLDRFERAKEGEGQVVLLCGEPGIGKSRLISSLRERLAGDPYTPLSHYCSPYHRNSALYPVIGLLERAAGLKREDPPGRKLDKLEALLALAVEDVQEVAPLLADLLSIPIEGRYPPLDLSPQRKKERIVRALLAQLEGLAAKQPVLALYEDVHWIDPSTLELLALAIGRVQNLSALVLVTYRPEFAPPWAGYAHVTQLSLNRLSRRQGEAIVERVTGGKPLPVEVLEQIALKTDGVPLYVEELTKAVLESGLLREEGGRYVVTGPLPPLAIPATLQDSLMARLDRLAPVKEVAQIGAAIGRTFSHELLAAVAPLREDELQDALAKLVEAELIFRRGVPPNATYSFKHALVQDAACNSLLKSRRQQLHARIVGVLEERFPETVETQPEFLAHHCTWAELREQAVDYWRTAGQRAMARSATAEAIAHLTAGLDLVRGLPPAPERDRRELFLETALGAAFVAAKGFAAPETGNAYARARELCERLGDVPQLFAVLYGLCLFHLYRAELDASRAAAERLLHWNVPGEDASLRFFALRAAGVSSFPRGDLTSARAHLEQALELYDPAQHPAPAFLYAFDPGVVCLDYLSRTLYPLGYPDQAMRRHGEALNRAREMGHHNTLALPLFSGAILCQLSGDHEGAAERARALVALAADEGFPFWLAGGTILQGWALADAGELEAGAARMREGIGAWRAAGAEYLMPYFLALLARVHHRAGRAAEGLGLLDEALDRAGSTGEHWFKAELHRQGGEMLLSLRPAGDEAEACLQQAMDVAQGQCARLWELRAAVSLGRLWRDRGRRAEARDLVAPIYAWFTEGFDTPDLKEARALLDEAS